MQIEELKRELNSINEKYQINETFGKIAIENTSTVQLDNNESDYNLIEDLKKGNDKLQNQINENSEYIINTVNRAVKIHNYIADKYGKERIIYDNEKHWEIIDKFTKEVRTYMRVQDDRRHYSEICTERKTNSLQSQSIFKDEYTKKKLEDDVKNLIKERSSILEEIEQLMIIRNDEKKKINSNNQYYDNENIFRKIDCNKKQNTDNEFTVKKL